ncbi:hypothetical protein AAFC00_007195 [Neodothiora populina]
MTDAEIAALKQDARYVFYHGMTNYHRYAYPEDELRPITCTPLTRDRFDPSHIEVNDVLGNYSLSVVDSLSTLAILASSPTSIYDKHNALDDFQKYIRLLVEEYGDGRSGPTGQGRRARGFDLDSKVQVFETTIRGVGGLLSAHLFAVGELPIRGYQPVEEQLEDGRSGILWDHDFVYDGQLLRLAQDLGERLLPAFHTPTGLPYPRVNLRHGTPFYENSPLNNDPEHGQCKKGRVHTAEKEITETCSAGAGSLVLEFTVLSRLTGDERFERLAKRAFWAVWERRNPSTGLLGAGIDAETGTWIGAFTGIGAGIDSFFEYAFKSHVLLSGSHYDTTQWRENSPESFLQTWHEAYASLTKHVRRDVQFQHPHYAQNDLYTGGPRLSWIDSLSAYYPGLLASAGEVEEASTVHLLYTALWTRYGALPERWNAQTGAIDNGLRWWGGRPEFIESTWYLYRATQDPWYLHVGEMTLRDIKRRCWTKCGWAGLQDVRTGEQSDRMESFFLGETAKYLYLLFDTEHPLNKLDAPWVFTTEGHPLIIPPSKRGDPVTDQVESQLYPWLSQGKCPIAPESLPFTMSTVAARPDIFHAASLARLHLMPKKDTPGAPLLDFSADHPSVTVGDIASPNNYTYFPWTLPPYLIPSNATSSKVAVRPTFDLTFPSLPSTGFDLGTLQKVDGGILVNSISGLRFGMVLEEDDAGEQRYRIHALSNLALGKDENLYLGTGTLSQVNPADPHFTRMRDTEVVDLIIDAPVPPLVAAAGTELDTDEAAAASNASVEILDLFDLDFTLDLDPDLFSAEHNSESSEAILSQIPAAVFADADRLAEQLDALVGILPDAIGVDNALRNAAGKLRAGQSLGPKLEKHSGSRDGGPVRSEKYEEQETLRRYTVPAMVSTGIGAAPLPLSLDTAPDPTTLDSGYLPYNSVLVIDSDLCDTEDQPPLTLSTDIPSNHNIIVVKRGGCSFSTKLSKIPSFAPSARGLQMVIVVSFPEHEHRKRDNDYTTDETSLVRPLLDEKQLTPKGVERRNGIAMAMVSGGEITWDTFVHAATAFGSVDVEGGKIVIRSSKNDEEEDHKGKRKSKAKDSSKRERAGIGIRRRYYWSSQGVRISNLFMR